MKRVTGQVTVFLSLTALSLFALFSTCLEASRCACVDYLCAQAAESSVRSVMAGFQGETLREYGLLMCRGRDGEISVWEDAFLEYAEKYLSPGKGTLHAAGDRISLQNLSVSGSQTVYVTEDNGAVFLETALTYMKSAGLAHLMQEVLARLGLYNEEDGTGLLQSISGMVGDKDSSLEGIIRSLDDIKEQAAALQEQARQQAEEDGTEYEEPEGTSEDVSSDLLEQIKAIRKNGLIAIITGSEELSEYPWQKEGLPSGLSDTEKAMNAGFGNEPATILNHLLLGEYMLHKMSCYTDPAEEGARYEAEYVLSGKKTDKASLETVIGEILLIRMGFNLAYLATDSEKTALAEATAAAIMSLLALPQLILLLKWLLLAAWALAESIVDLRGLVRGKKVPFWKSAQTWRLSVMKLDLESDGGGNAGLSYEDYLRILFFIGDTKDQSYRMMDVIQERIGRKVPGFRMRDYMVYADVSLETDVSYLYITAPFIRNETGSRFGRRYRKEAAYGYGRR